MVTPDSERMHMQFYETEAYDWLAVEATGGGPGTDRSGRERPAGRREAEAYRIDLLAAIDRSILRSPGCPVRRWNLPLVHPVRALRSRVCIRHLGLAPLPGTYRSNLLGHGPVGRSVDQPGRPALAARSARAGPSRRARGSIAAGEYEGPRTDQATIPSSDWFSHASWQYQCGLERHANIHLKADDVPNFLRSMLNQYAVDIMPGAYTFREHTTGGPPDKIYEESCFLERLRDMLVMEDGATLWLARATPRAWLTQGQKLVVRRAPSHFGTVSYEILAGISKLDKITATVDLPYAPSSQDSSPAAPPPRRRKDHEAVEVNGTPWKDVDADRELIQLQGQSGRVVVIAHY